MKWNIIGKSAKLIIILLAAVSLALPFYVVPNAFGNSFTSSNLSITYLTYSAAKNCDCEPFKVLQDNLVQIVEGVGFSVHLSNSYFLPVAISYQGYEVAVFIYSTTVDRPGAATFANQLVWRSTASADLADEDNVRFPNREELLEHTASVPTSGMQFELADDETAWNGTDTRVHALVQPGVYYAYGLALGRLSSPVTFEVVSS